MRSKISISIEYGFERVVSQAPLISTGLGAAYLMVPPDDAFFEVAPSLASCQILTIPKSRVNGSPLAAYSGSIPRFGYECGITLRERQAPFSTLIQ